MTDAEMGSSEEEKEMKVSGGGGIREIMEECSYLPYYYQPFNEVESQDWRYRDSSLQYKRDTVEFFRRFCPGYTSFEFPILPVLNGEVKPCSYSELEKITDFKTDSMILRTHLGRLFRGTITEGSETRSVIVKTWDLSLPKDHLYIYRPSQFCDEIELYEIVNAHPCLAKLTRYCCDQRLAVVYDEAYSKVLSEVLLEDDFGWDKRINVATQLAGLYACLHKHKISVGSLNAICILIDKEVNIKVFDFGSIFNRVNEDSEIPAKYYLGRLAPEIPEQGWTMKSDVYIFGLLLIELISKIKFGPHPSNEAKPERYLVHKCFDEVDDQTASDISELTCRCLNLDPGERPTMKMVLDDLRKLSMGESVGGKRKRDENDAKIE